MGEFIITIDGPAGVGKTTVSKLLAQQIGFVYVDTGAMYRAAALVLKERGIDLKDTDNIKSNIAQLNLNFVFKNGNFLVYLEDRDISQAIRTPEMDMLSSRVSQIVEVRKVLWDLQRKFAKKFKRTIFEGRDMGTVVFPQADLKFFLTATPEVRAQRRWRQLQEAGKDVDYKEIYDAIKLRDKQDSERKVAPLKPAADAIVIDTTDIGPQEVVEQIKSHFYKIRR